MLPVAINVLAFCSLGMSFFLRREIYTLNFMTVGGLATTISSAIFPQFADLNRYDGAVIIWLGSSAAVDLVITISLVWSLVGYRRFMILIQEINSLETSIHAKRDIQPQIESLIGSFDVGVSLWEKIFRYISETFSDFIQTGGVTALSALLDLVVHLAVRVSNLISTCLFN